MQKVEEQFKGGRTGRGVDTAGGLEMDPRSAIEANSGINRGAWCRYLSAALVGQAQIYVKVPVGCFIDESGDRNSNIGIVEMPPDIRRQRG